MPQFLEDQVAADGLLAAQQIALELRNEHGARLRLERPEIIAQPFDGVPVARHESQYPHVEGIGSF